MKVCLSFICLALLVACDQTLIPEPHPNDFENQEVIWEPCDPAALALVAALPAALDALEGRLECATLTAPLDWNNPASDSLNLGVLRVRAGNEAERKGAIVVNPGGPGGDGLPFGALIGAVFATNGGAALGFETATPELLAQISERYDVIGFSPRGLGGSSQFFCGSNAVLPATNFYTDRSEENVQALLTTGQHLAEACLSNPLYPYISTEQTVRNMDLIRRLLGDEKLNYLGYSYGSWLGAWYAKRFPERVGNMVLDANLDFSASTDLQNGDSDYYKGMERSLRDVALPYAARNNTLYALGNTAEEVYDIYDSLPRELKSALVLGRVSLVRDLYSSNSVDDIAAKLVTAKGVQAVLGTFGQPTQENLEEFLEELSAHSYSENSTLDKTARELAFVIGEDYVAALVASSSGQRVTLDPNGDPFAKLNSVYTAIVCNDAAFNDNPTFWRERGDALNQRYPLLGGSETVQPCAFWPKPTSTMPATPEDIPAILMVQNGFDGPTPVESALRAFRSLPDAKLVYVENEMSHTTFLYNTSCVDAKVATFLLNGVLPKETISSCAALPLPGEEDVYAPGGVPSFDKQNLSAQDTAEQARDNPLYKLAKEILLENAVDLRRK